MNPDNFPFNALNSPKNDGPKIQERRDTLSIS